MSEENESATACHNFTPESYIEEKFYMIAIIGSSISAWGVLANVGLALVLLGWPKFRRTHMLYLGWLALADIVLCACYIGLFSVEILYDYYRDLKLFLAWHTYVREMFTFSRIAGTMGTYLIVAAAAERLVLVSGRDPCWPRWLVVLTVVLLSVGSRLSIYWELIIDKRPKCVGFTQIKLLPGDLAKNPYYRSYSLWFNNVMQTFGPFLTMLGLNVAIVLQLRRTLRGASMGRRQDVRYATWTLLAIVTCYLVSNSLAFLLGLIEHLDYNFLSEHFAFYTFASDLTNILHVSAASVRVFIYCACNPTLRATILKLLHLQNEFSALNNSLMYTNCTCASETAPLNSSYGFKGIGIDENGTLLHTTVRHNNIILTTF